MKLYSFVYADLDAHTHTHIFLIRLVFDREWFVRDCAVDGGWNHKWHSFRQLYDYGIDIVVHFDLVVHFCTKWNSLVLPSFCFVCLCIRNAKERGELFERVAEHAPCIHLNQQWTQKPIDNFYMYRFGAVYSSHCACVCVHFYHRRFFTASRLIPVDQVSFHLKLVCMRASARARVRTPLHSYTTSQMYKFRILRW